MTTDTTETNPMTDPQIKEKLLGYLTSMESGLKSGGDFVMSQAPELAREIVAYNWWYSLIVVVVLVLSLIVLAVAWKRWIPWLNKADYSGDEVAMPLAIFGTIGLACLSIGNVSGLYSHANTLLKCSFAPRYFLIETIAAMIKGHAS